MEKVKFCTSHLQNNSGDSDLLVTSPPELKEESEGFSASVESYRTKCLNKMMDILTDLNNTKDCCYSYQQLCDNESGQSLSDIEDTVQKNDYLDCFTNCFPRYSNTVQFQKLEDNGKIKRENSRIPVVTVNTGGIKVYYGDTSMCSNNVGHKDMLHMTENHTGRKTFQVYRGQIQLSVSIHKNLSLKVLIPKVQDLPTLPENQNIYIKATISGKVSSRKTAHTSPVNCRRQYEGEEMCLQLKKKDLQEKVHISVCIEGSAQVIGCMSFSLHKLHKMKSITGWYYLLQKTWAGPNT